MPKLKQSEYEQKVKQFRVGELHSLHHLLKFTEEERYILFWNTPGQHCLGKPLGGATTFGLWRGKQDLNSMSFSNYAIYCPMQFLQSAIYGVMYHPVQRSNAVSEVVKGRLFFFYRSLRGQRKCRHRFCFGGIFFRFTSNICKWSKNISVHYVNSRF